MISEKQVLEALPRAGFLRSYVEWGQRWIGSSIAFHVPAALILLSQTVPTQFSFPWVTPLRANLFALLVGPSTSSGKTRTIQAAQRVLMEAVPDAEMIRPGSPEACLDTLEGRPQVIFYDEFGWFLQGTEAGQLRPLRMLLTDLYDCGKTGRNLVVKQGRKPKRPVLDPRLSLLGGVTPGLLEEHTTDVDWNEGFLARFFTIHADVEDPKWITADPKQSQDERARLVELLRSYLRNDPFSVIPGPCEGIDFRTERTIWQEWCQSLRRRAKQEDPAIRAAVHRAEGHALKIALLLSWDIGSAREAEPWRIEDEALSTAIAITEWHISSVEEIAEGLASSRDMQDERRMFRAIGTEPIVYGEALKKARLTKRRGDEMIASLLEKKLITRVNDLDLTAPIRYVRIRQSNVIPFPVLEGEEGKGPKDPFF